MRRKVPHYRIKLLPGYNPNKVYGIIVSNRKGGKGTWLLFNMETKEQWYSSKESAEREVERKKEQWRRCPC